MADEPQMPDVLTLHAQVQPDKVAAIDDRPNVRATSLTFRQLNAEVNRLANALVGLGVQPRDKVVWCGMNSLGVVRIIHAARKIGATAVPLNYRLSADEAAYVIDDCDAVMVYVDSEFASLPGSVRKRTPKVRNVVVFDGQPGADMIGAEALIAGASDAEPSATQKAETAATMIYTSGTTGRPKGALRVGQGNREQILQMIAMIGYVPDDIYITTGPLYHSGPLGFFVLAQSLGNTAIIQRKFDPEDWLRLVEKHKVTTTFSAPTPIRMVCNLPDAVRAKYNRSSMKRMLANAAPWSFALKELYLRDFPEDSLWEIYGSTELGVDTILEPKDQRRKPGSCGKPAPGVEVKLFDEEGDEVTEPHKPGELFLRSGGVFNTYHKAQDKYDRDRRGDFHTVGDVAYRDEEGYYYICDRKSDMIISGGMNIYPAEIEAALEQHPKIIDVAVFGIPSEQWGESVHAVIVSQPGTTLTEQDVVAFAREHLASYKIPRSVSFLEEIPRTGSGKILKRVLREPYWKDHKTRVL